MGIFDKLSQPFQAKKLKKEQLDRINQLIWQAVADGIVTDDESKEIDSFFYGSELEAADVQKAKSNVFVDLVRQAIADRRVTSAEYTALENIGKQLSLHPDALNWMRAQVQNFRFLSHIEEGGPLPTVQAPSMILQKGEIAHVAVPAQMYEERVVRSTYQGGSRGVSIRLMKGISYRVGGHRGQIQSERALVIKSTGTFVITNQRLVFSGDKKSAATTYSKFLDFQVYSDAIQYSVTNRQKPFIIGFPENDTSELCALIISRILNESES